MSQRGKKILMVRHERESNGFYTLPGGGIEKGETPERAAVRELWEECHVTGTIVKKLSEYSFPLGNDVAIYTFHVDIGKQTPLLGPNLSEEEKKVLREVRWMSLDEICERDRAFLWAAGLASIRDYYDELTRWKDDISYPGKP